MIYTTRQPGLDNLLLVSQGASGHSRNVSTASLANGQKGEGIGSLVRLVEALEMYDNGAMDSYMTEDSLESAALMKGSSGRHRRKV